MRQNFAKLNMMRVIAAVMAVMLTMALMVPCVSAAGSGSCGSGLVWQYANGTLTISGKGAMEDYTETRPAPWDAFKQEIRVVNIDAGVTSVGNYAFYGCSIITSVTLADSVVSVGDFAFASCTGLKMLRFGAGLRSVGESSFECCSSLQSVRIPNGVTTLGRKAFYRCDGLRSVTVPSSVTLMGSMVFARCNGLVTADVQASVEVLPLWMFYSCDALSQVTLAGNIRALENKAFHLCENLRDIHYLGSTTDGEEILTAVQETLPDFSDSSLHYQQSTNAAAESTSGYVDDTKIVSEAITVRDSQNANISTTVTTTTTVGGTVDEPVLSKPQTSVKIEAVIETAQGWSELVEQIEAGTEKAATADEQTLQVSVSLNDTEDLKGETLDALAGKDVNVTVQMTDGTEYRIDCGRLDSEGERSDSYSMSYTVEKNTAPTENQTQALGEADSYVLTFAGDTDFDFSPKIFVGGDRAHSCATLYQILDSGELQKLQSSIVDRDGNATFYLQSAYSDTQYVVALDVADVDRAEAIIPNELAAEYGVTEEYQVIEYVPTVRVFMGMNIGQFSFAIFAVIFVLFVVVGIVMAVIFRKRKLEFMYKMKMAEEQGVSVDDIE